MKTNKLVCLKHFKSIVLASVFLLPHFSAFGQLTVQTSDITGVKEAGGYYKFLITPSGFGENGMALTPGIGSLMGGALVSADNLLYVREDQADGASFITPNQNTQASAVMVLGWDFTQTNYRPTSVDLLNIVVRLEAGTPADPVNITLSWSTDNKTWTPYVTLSGTDDYIHHKADAITLDKPDKCFMKYEVVGITNQTNNFGIQWGRVQKNGSGGNQAFSANFVVAPK